jgi:TolB-like protein
MFAAVFFSLTFAYSQQPDNGESYSTVDRGVSGMIAEVLKQGYRQPPVSIAVVSFTYKDTGMHSEYSGWLERTLKESLLRQQGLGVVARGVEEQLEAPQRAQYKAFSERLLADWMLRGSFQDEGAMVRVDLELVDLATSQIVNMFSLRTGRVYTADGRILAVISEEGGGSPEVAQTGWVVIRVPEGLRVNLKILDMTGKEVKLYPGSGGEQVKLPLGRYRIEAEDHPGMYEPFQGQFDVGMGRVRVDVALKPRFGALELHVEPRTGVSVIVNGRTESSTSSGVWDLEGLTAGTYVVVASKDLYKTERRSVEVKAGERTRVELKLEENKYRLEVVAGGGVGGKVYVDGKARGSLPVTMDVPFGPAQLRVEPDDLRYRVWEKKVEPKVAGSTERVSVVFGERTGLVEITTSPAIEAQLRAREIGGGWREIGTSPMDWIALLGEYELEGRGV